LVAGDPPGDAARRGRSVLVGLGAAVGSGAAFRFDAAVACLAVALLLQIAANLANDLADFRRGADTPDRMGRQSGGRGLMTERASRSGSP